MIDQYLFVYGSLLMHFQNSMTRILKSQSTFIGEYHLPGTLYDLGRYPGFVFDPTKSELVYGHLFQLNHPAKVFEIVDCYEGIDPTNPTESEYLRMAVERVVKEKIATVWFYQYNLEVSGLTIISDGNYPEYVKKVPAHRAFLKSV